ncbi:hypothetical protein WJX74_007675 [Apatococcus lobatus]|uniref:Uncharacterized protein n=1 Tax=Apatococcus lobatus TaxID=904363 RepID=A0AAW1QVQ0_9CHLO
MKNLGSFNKVHLLLAAIWLGSLATGEDRSSCDPRCWPSELPNPRNPNPYLQTDPEGTAHDIAALLDLFTMTFERFHITESPFCSGHVIMPNGLGLIVGGDNEDLSWPLLSSGLTSIRIIDPFKASYILGPELPSSRWYPSLLTLANGNILIMGGAQVPGGDVAGECLATGATRASTDNPSYIIYDPDSNSLSADVPFTLLSVTWPFNLYPFLALLPGSRSILVISGNQVAVSIISDTGWDIDTDWGAPVSLPVPVLYPQTAAITLLPLSASEEWQPQVLVCGGSSVDCAGPSSPASGISYLINVAEGANHTPVQEQMPSARVMGDCVALPDGTIFCCNGAAIGIAGGSPGYGNASSPTTAGAIYDPSRPAGSRWQGAADSAIARLYHSTAVLTQNAEVMVAGSEATVEYRVQVYTPAYLLTANPRPTIVRAPNLIAPGSRFPIQFSGVPSIDRVVLSRLPGVTHSVHMDARQLVLNCAPTVSGSSSGITCQAPPDFTVVPPGAYLLFILSRGVPSRGQYVNITLGPPALPPGSYIIQSASSVRNAYASVAADCHMIGVGLWRAQDGSGQQAFSIQLPDTRYNSYTIQASFGRPGCSSSFWSPQACSPQGSSAPQLVGSDDGSGMQHWVISQVPASTNQYYIISSGLANQCHAFLGVTACGSTAGLGTFSGDDGTGAQLWSLIPVSGFTPDQPIPPPLSSGIYTIQNVGRACSPYVSIGQSCSDRQMHTWPAQDGSGRQIFSLQLLANGRNDYIISTTAGRNSCNSSLLTVQACGGSGAAMLGHPDESSQQQHWSIGPVPGILDQFYIVARGRDGNCPALLGGSTCSGMTDTISCYNEDDGSRLQRWTLTAAAALPAAGSGPPIANGLYQILATVGRRLDAQTGWRS